RGVIARRGPLDPRHRERPCLPPPPAAAQLGMSPRRALREAQTRCKGSRRAAQPRHRRGLAAAAAPCPETRMRGCAWEPSGRPPFGSGASAYHRPLLLQRPAPGSCPLATRARQRVGEQLPEGPVGGGGAAPPGSAPSWSPPVGDRTGHRRLSPGFKEAALRAAVQRGRLER
ncbi:hypothetical protein KIL84_012353, partial [Mauremys mutica]